MFRKILLDLEAPGLVNGFKYFGSLVSISAIRKSRVTAKKTERSMLLAQCFLTESSFTLRVLLKRRQENTRMRFFH